LKSGYRLSLLAWTRDRSPASRPPAVLRDETIFLKPRNHPEAEARYQGGMTALGGFRMTMVEVVVAAGAALGSACIFLAHAIEAYHAD
jgi:hypothetical protein